jgi:hypothetical protein
MEKYKSFIELKYEPFYKDQTTSLLLIYNSKSQILKSNTEKSVLIKRLQKINIKINMTMNCNLSLNFM